VASGVEVSRDLETITDQPRPLSGQCAAVLALRPHCGFSVGGSQEDRVTVIDLSFPASGQCIPRDHGYPLYAALCRALPELHRARWLGVHPFSGVVVEGEQLRLRDTAEMRLRLPAERIPDVLSLAGGEIDVGGNALRLGTPRVYPLVPAPNLDARIVVVHLTRAPRRFNAALGREALDVESFEDRYRAELSRQLQRQGAQGKLTLEGRRTIQVAGRRLIGYSVRVEGIDAEESLRLQESGLGGKRSMGCGLFRRTRLRQASD